MLKRYKQNFLAANSRSTLYNTKTQRSRITRELLYLITLRREFSMTARHQREDRSYATLPFALAAYFSSDPLHCQLRAVFVLWSNTKIALTYPRVLFDHRIEVTRKSCRRSGAHIYSFRELTFKYSSGTRSHVYVYMLPGGIEKERQYRGGRLLRESRKCRWRW